MTDGFLLIQTHSSAILKSFIDRLISLGQVNRQEWIKLNLIIIKLIKLIN